MIQAQATARRRLTEILKGQHSGLASSTMSELRSIQRRAKKDEYTITMDEQVKIEAAYEIALNPLGLTEPIKRKKVS